MSNLKVLVLIPSRYESSRFPGKPLAPIAKKSMIQRVYENLSHSVGLDLETYVVTDDERIENHVLEFGGKAIRVDDEVESGSERIYLAYERNFQNQSFDFIVNVQGDEPLLSVFEIEEIVKYQYREEVDIATIVTPINSLENNPNQVKVIYNKENGRCHYFSRAMIPFFRDNVEKENRYGHIGVYSFTKDSLKKMNDLGPSYYENIEKLEQLRAIEAGMSIGAVLTEEVLIGVDHPDDIKKVEGALNERT